MAQCATHPGVETELRCGRCEKFICPRCLVQTPVGARCRECARLRPLPIFQISPAYYLRALGAGLGMALMGGTLWGILPTLGFLSFFIVLGAGYLVGEAVSLAVNRKRGRWLQAVAGTSFLLAYLVSQVAPTLLLVGSQGSLLAHAATLALKVLTYTLLNPFALLALGLGLAIAVYRLG